MTTTLLAFFSLDDPFTLADTFKFIFLTIAGVAVLAATFAVGSYFGYKDAERQMAEQQKQTAAGNRSSATISQAVENVG